VETVAEMQVLSAADCDELQGYLFGKPMPAEIFDEWRNGYSRQTLTNPLSELIIIQEEEPK
jgi:EAL domain-containing protein (putative c-di-GMP-specific phosphodiesterase class I)